MKFRIDIFLIEFHNSEYIYIQNIHTISLG